MTKTACCLLVSILLFTACHEVAERSESEREAFKNEHNARKIRRVTPGDLVEAARTEGRLLLDSLATVKDSITLLKNWPSLATYRTVVLDTIFGEALPLYNKEQQIAQAYYFANVQEQALPDNIQMLPDGQVLFTTHLKESRPPAMLSLVFNPKPLILKLPPVKK